MLILASMARFFFRGCEQCNSLNERSWKARDSYQQKREAALPASPSKVFELTLLAETSNETSRHICTYTPLATLQPQATLGRNEDTGLNDTYP